MKTQIREAIAKHIVPSRRKPRSYRKYGDTIRNKDGECIYTDNGSEILVVAHLDTVLWERNPVITDDRIDDCPQLDDRLGVAIALEMVNSLVGETVDVLLTDCEEKCNSTAKHFALDVIRQHRLAIQFDRAGSDCVNYDDWSYPSIDESLETCGIEVGRGSYSDVAELSCPAINWGCGYHLQHTHGCYCNLAEVELQLLKFTFWFKEFGYSDFPKIERPKIAKTKYRGSKYSSWQDDYSGWWRDNGSGKKSTIVSRNLLDTLDDDELHLLEE